MFFSHYTKEEKQEIANQLKNHTEESAYNDYKKIKKIVEQHEINTIAPLSPIGLKFIEKHIYLELLSTKSKQGISFFDFWYHRDYYLTRDKATCRLIESIQKNKPYLSEIKIAKQVFNLYCGGIHIFRPLNALKVYQQFQPTCVLDCTMGWGGRMLAATLLNIPHYIGIDSNMYLEKPYKEMIDFLSPFTKTKMDVYFQDCLTMDYSSLQYDMVFTSPPYYNKEIYRTHKEKEEEEDGKEEKEEKDTIKKKQMKTKEEWNETFYIPLFHETWKYLQPGGIYCLNVPNEIYETLLLPWLGEANEKRELKKFSRLLPKRTDTKQYNVGQQYNECIYVWYKMK